MFWSDRVDVMDMNMRERNTVDRGAGGNVDNMDPQVPTL